MKNIRGYGSWGGGQFGVGNLIVGSTSLTTAGKQVSFKSDMVVTAGYRSIFDAQYQVTLSLGANSTSGAASLTFNSDDVILITGTPMDADVGAASLTITENNVEAISTAILEVGSQTLTTTENTAFVNHGNNITVGSTSVAFTSFATTITTSVIATPGLGSIGSSTTFQPTLSIGNNLTLGTQAVAISEHAPTITTSVVAEPGLGSVGSSSTFQPNLIIGNNLSVGSTSVGFTENTAFVNNGHNITVGTQTVAISKHAPNVTASVVLTPGVGSLTTSTKQILLSVGANIAVGYREILDAQYQVSVVIGNVINAGIDRDPHETVTISGKQPGLKIGNVIPLGTINESQVASYQPTVLAGSFQPAGRTIAPLAQSRSMIAVVLSADGNDLVVKDVALEQSRSLIETASNNGGNDILKVA